MKLVLMRLRQRRCHSRSARGQCCHPVVFT